MNWVGNSSQSPLSNKAMTFWAVLAVVSFHLAYSLASLASFIAIYLWAMCALTRVASPRRAFYLGLGIGLGIFGPQLAFFWTIFGPSAVALWMILAFWIALFLLLANLTWRKLGPLGAALLIPFLWTGLEYFRSELYYLRFSWLSIGYTFGESLFLQQFGFLGLYGIGFMLAGAAAMLSLWSRRIACGGAVVLTALLALLTNRSPVAESAPAAEKRPLVVAGMQLEFPSALEVPARLDKLIQKHPQSELLILSEYTFDGPVPKRVLAWCRANHRYLIVGGKSPQAGVDFCNTAFVIGPEGTVVFEQVKSVPIQFFKDGQPAKVRNVWQSPWGKIGICICYDLSYTRVADDFIRQGAQALIVPTMDVREWGEHQHRLHARVAPVRVAEYGIPIFRVASSGISQFVDRTGMVRASAAFGGEGEMIRGELVLSAPGSQPVDRVLAPVSVCITGLVIVGLIGAGIRGRRTAAILPARSSDREELAPQS